MVRISPELLLSKGYAVHGIVRRSSSCNLQRIEHLRDDLELHPADLLDQSSLNAVVAKVRPDEVYNLGAQSFVPPSFVEPVLTAEITALGANRLLDAVRAVDPAI
jgi:GDPmannose 4,6-dehydratase